MKSPSCPTQRSLFGQVLLCHLGRGWERQALLHCFGLSVGRAAMQMCLTVRNETVNCRAGITHNVSACDVLRHRS